MAVLVGGVGEAKPAGVFLRSTFPSRLLQSGQTFANTASMNASFSSTPGADPSTPQPEDSGARRMSMDQTVMSVKSAIRAGIPKNFVKDRTRMFENVKVEDNKGRDAIASAPSVGGSANRKDGAVGPYGPNGGVHESDTSVSGRCF